MIEYEGQPCCEIIDRYFYDINLNLVLSSGFVKPSREIPVEITDLTSITNEMCETGDSLC